MISLYFNTVTSIRGKYKDGPNGNVLGSDGLHDHDHDNSSDHTHTPEELAEIRHKIAHKREQDLRLEASVIVVVVFLIVTIGMFICCRYIPELVMDKCNY